MVGQDILKKWYTTVSVEGVRIQTKEEVYYLYRGFKISLSNKGRYSISDLRYRDVYSPLLESDRSLLIDHGFILGCDLIRYARDYRREIKYRKAAEYWYTYRDSIRAREEGYTLRLSNCNRVINSKLDLMIYYKIRLKQFKDKYESEISAISDRLEVISRMFN